MTKLTDLYQKLLSHMAFAIFAALAISSSAYAGSGSVTYVPGLPYMSYYSVPETAGLIQPSASIPSTALITNVYIFAKFEVNNPKPANAAYTIAFDLCLTNTTSCNVTCANTFYFNSGLVDEVNLSLPNWNQQSAKQNMFAYFVPYNSSNWCASGTYSTGNAITAGPDTPQLTISYSY